MTDALVMLAVLPLLLVVLPVAELKCLLREVKSGRVPWKTFKKLPRSSYRLANGLQTAMALSVFCLIWLAIFAVSCLLDSHGRSLADPLGMRVSRHDPNALAPLFVALSGTALLLHLVASPILVLIANVRRPHWLSLPASLPWLTVAGYTAWVLFHPLLAQANGG